MKDPVAEAYARGGRVASRKYGAAVERPRGRESSGFPEMKVRPAAARPARMPAPPAQRQQPALDPRRMFPVSRRGSGADATAGADAMAVEASEDEFAAMRRGGRVGR